MLLRLLPAALLLAGMLSAQSITGTILGTIEDPGGLSVAGAGITLTQVSTGVTRQSKTAANGSFSFATLDPGRYTVQVHASGFKTAQIDSIILSASETLPLGTVRLEVGNISQSVTIFGNGARTVLVENASRFARDLAVQITGHDMLKSHGISLVPVDAPNHFQDETPTATMVRSILGAVSQFEKEALVLKLRKARELGP